MLVSYSAMSNGDLRAVDKVIKVVRELDRYQGFSPRTAARRGTRRPCPPRRPAARFAGTQGDGLGSERAATTVSEPGTEITETRLANDGQNRPLPVELALFAHDFCNW
jgi:hypothetical protein